VVSGTFSAPAAGLAFLRVAIGGAAFGLAVAWLGLRLVRRLDDPGIVTVLTLLWPFAAYLTAEFLGVSGVLATVVAGIYLGWYAPTALTPETRVQAGAVWSTLVFLLNGLAFILIGLQLPFIRMEIAEADPLLLVQAAGAVIGTVIAVRIVWVYGVNGLTLLASRVRRHEPPPLRILAVVSWAGMRGIISLAAALALPEVIDSGAPFPQRGLVLFLAFCVILATLVVQGLSLPALARALGVVGASSAEETLEARRLAFEAALLRLDELAMRDDLPADGIAQLRQRYEYALRVLDERDAAAGDAATYLRVQRDVIEAERKLLIDLRRSGAIPDDVFRELERMLDLRTTWLS
jgi:CPA1 family monovalent cation:H+ antiporter